MGRLKVLGPLPKTDQTRVPPYFPTSPCIALGFSTLARERLGTASKILIPSIKLTTFFIDSYPLCLNLFYSLLFSSNDRLPIAVFLNPPVQGSFAGKWVLYMDSGDENNNLREDLPDWAFHL